MIAGVFAFKGDATLTASSVARYIPNKRELPDNVGASAHALTPQPPAREPLLFLQQIAQRGRITLTKKLKFVKVIAL